ncbi:hypothetical protein CYMTET_16342 [Cymbomonas tetramitiformis]|uniref:Uncharacterized protein n=1 Tax=Cymbomonas tetramitiformis TaxID=36881 RepID=A0AAE0GCK9_9CHLO|nr:hypothetical protein CYMTET_16342 [Cymbomonas tetramitiformis]
MAAVDFWTRSRGVSRLVGVRQSHQEEHAALRYEFGVNLRATLATESRLVRENLAPDWTPTEETRRKQLYDRLDVDFYRGIVDKYAMPDALAKEMLKTVLDNKIRVLEHYIRTQKGCAAALRTPDMARGSLAGYRTGLDRTDGPPVGFDTAAKKAVPQCFKCSKAGKLVFQKVADAADEAFAAVVELHDAPAAPSPEAGGSALPSAASGGALLAAGALTVPKTQDADGWCSYTCPYTGKKERAVRDDDGECARDVDDVIAGMHCGVFSVPPEQCDSEDGCYSGVGPVAFLSLICFCMLGVGAAVCLGAAPMADSTPGGINTPTDPVICNGQVCLYPAIDSLNHDTL